MGKPIYERKVWQVMHAIAKHLGEAKRHLAEAERIATDYVIEDKNHSHRKDDKDGREN